LRVAYFALDYFCDFAFARETSKQRESPKNIFSIKEHFEGAKPALYKGDLNIREIRFYFCLHPGSFGEIVSTFTIFDSDLHGGKMVLSL